MVLTVKIMTYCETCEHKVVLRRKNFDHMYHEVLCFLIFTGIGFLIYLILKYSKKKNTCPNCESIFDLEKLKSEKSTEIIPENSKIKV